MPSLCTLWRAFIKHTDRQASVLLGAAVRQAALGLLGEVAAVLATIITGSAGLHCSSGIRHVVGFKSRLPRL
jgi:hypothetical protein